MHKSCHAYRPRLICTGYLFSRGAPRDRCERNNSKNRFRTTINWRGLLGCRLASDMFWTTRLDLHEACYCQRCFWTFRSRLVGQQLSATQPVTVRRSTWRDLATLTFKLGGHGAYRWYGSSCSISINRPGDLDFWPWNCCALFWYFCAFYCPIMGQHLSGVPREIAILNFDLETVVLYCTWSEQPSYKFWYAPARMQ